MHDPSPGARIGEKSATVAHISSGKNTTTVRRRLVTKLQENMILKHTTPKPAYWVSLINAIHFASSRSDVDDIVDRVANIITSEDEQSLTKSWRSQFEE